MTLLHKDKRGEELKERGVDTLEEQKREYAAGAAKAFFMEYMWLMAILILLLVIVSALYLNRDNIGEQLEYAFRMLLEKMNPMYS